MLVLSFVLGALAWFVAIARGLRGSPRLQRAGRVLLHTSLAAFLTVVLVLIVNTVLPLHLDGWIRRCVPAQQDMGGVRGFAKTAPCARPGVRARALGS